jgi:steroid delta-isomerase-like uncharacterized protein
MKSVTLTRAFGMLVLCVMVGCATPATELEANKALLHEYHQDIWVKGQLETMPQYVAQDFRSHAVADDAPQGVEPSTQFMQMVWAAFPDMQSHEDALFGEGDRVVIQWTIDATHKGNFLGVPATNKPIHISGMDVLRVQNGKFVEHWGGFGDQIDVIFRQIQQ